MIKPVTDAAFEKYGLVLEGYDFSSLLATLNKTTEQPADRVLYVASDPKLEAEPIFADLRDRAFGGIPVQVGYCSGANTKLNCLEYHRGSEVCVAADDIIMLLAKREEIKNWSIDTSKVEAFLLPRGAGIIYWETSMHYAPAKKDGLFRNIIALPRGTNTEKPVITPKNREDKLLAACNKWLLAHPDSAEAKTPGIHVGITGENIDVRDL
ncbi:MAG: DUF4867 family protein [Treponema sp.]|jgi:hypothetical protein|nr:DUF4867 family protein [Treponema sp.]